MVVIIYLSKITLHINFGKYLNPLSPNVILTIIDKKFLGGGYLIIADNSQSKVENSCTAII
jgi:hypothetical protein